MAINKHPSERYRVIDRVIGQRKKVKTVDLQKAILSELALDKISIRQIEKDLEAMQEAPPHGYNAPLKQDNRSRAWYYTDPEFSIQNFGLRAEEIKALKFYASSIYQYRDYNLFKDFSTAIDKVVRAVRIQSKLAGDSRIVIQTDNIDYVKGNEFIVDLADCVEERKLIRFNYQKYGHAKPTKRLVEPLLLKEYRNRWYLIANNITKEKKELRTFALDRISDLVCSEEYFTMDGSFEPLIYYKHSFGIIRQDSSVEKVILEFAASQKNYLESLPIHSTQKILSATKSKIRVSLEIIPSYEFYECILGYGELVKVISPKHLVDQIKDRINKASQHYLK
jgi:predicted DNA-binding transcriptional regulator YafY